VPPQEHSLMFWNNFFIGFGLAFLLHATLILIEVLT
jgi:hypothetical protein